MDQTNVQSGRFGPSNLNNRWDGGHYSGNLAINESCYTSHRLTDPYYSPSVSMKSKSFANGL